MNEAAIVSSFPESGDQYLDLSGMARALFEGERDFLANAANLTALIFERLPELNWCGFYLTRGDELVLGPFQGKVACVRIPFSKGVCGTSAARSESIVVADVHSFAGHIACDPDSRSEVVVPLVSDGKVVGVLDIDSPTPGRFDESDARGLERVVEVLLDSSELPTWLTGMDRREVRH